MDLFVKIMSKSDTLSSVLQFQTDDVSSYWREALFNAYPFLDKEKCSLLAWKDRKQYLTSELSKFYDKIKMNLQKKCILSQQTWNEKKENINHIYTKVFDINCYNLFNNMVAEISLNPICPRNIKQHSYSVFWAGDELNFLKTSLHEMIHFVWFYIWKQHFNDCWEEYEAPNLKWILSEMVIDTLIKNTDIGNIYPENPKKKNAYSYFYNMKINNQFILHELSSMYRNSPNIINFMDQAYLYCKENEKDIRKQIL